MCTHGIFNNRRPFGLYRLCVLLVAMLTAAAVAAHTFEVRAVMSKDGAQVYFDPVGLHIQPGDTVRWIQINGYHFVAAHHSTNGNH